MCAEGTRTSKLLLEYGDEGVGGAEVEVGNGLEHVAGGDLLSGAVESLIVGAGISMDAGAV